MDASELARDSNVYYKLKCNSNRHAKRELTVGETYIGCTMENDGMLIKNDFGQQNIFALWRFDLIEILNPYGRKL